MPVPAARDRGDRIAEWVDRNAGKLFILPAVLTLLAFALLPLLVSAYLSLTKLKLAAIENQPRDQLEAARIDGAGGWQIFRDITWPAIAPVAATIVLIRLIEAFKIIDLPNVLTNGGPGIATESLTLHAFIAWRTQDLGGSAAVGYTLLFVATVACLSFFNFAGRRTRRAEA